MPTTTAIQIVQAAYRQANEETPSSFGTSQNWPQAICLDLLNGVISEMNRMGTYWFTEASQALTHGSGVYTYNLETLNIDPRMIKEVRREATNFTGVLTQVEASQFRRIYRSTAVATATPSVWAKYGYTLELDCISSQNFNLRVYYWRELPLMSATTDTLLSDSSYDDVYIVGVMAYLKKRMGKPDWQTDYQEYLEKIKQLLSATTADTGLAAQMPARF